MMPGPFSRFFFVASLQILIAAEAFGQPHIAYRGIVNAASYAPGDLPSGAIAQGSIFSVFGSGLGPATLMTAPGFPVQTSLGGVSVKVTQGKTTVNALPLVVSAGQLNVVMPSNAPLGRVSVQVIYNGNASNYSPAAVSSASFGIFAANSGGFGPGILQNFVSATELPINSTVQPAKPGDTLVLWGTGLGPVANDAVAPPAASLSTPVTVWVGGVQASLLYNGRSPCCSGVDQIVLTVPANAPLGCYVPVQVQTNGTTISNTVTVAISPDGKTCSDAANPISNAYVTGGNLVVATVNRHVVFNDIGVSTPQTNTYDYAIVSAGKESGGGFEFNRAVSLPPYGTCTTYVQAGGLLSSASLGFFGAVLPSGASLDAGSALTLQTQSRQVTIPQFPWMPYGAPLGSSATAASPPLLTPGQAVTLSAPGGADVSKFQVTMTPPALNWTNESSVETVARHSNLTVNWGAQNGTVVVVGTNYDIPTNASATFVCTADGGAGTLTVPSYILSALPASRNLPLSSYGFLMVGYSAPPATFSAAGLAAGFARAITWADKEVLFQ